MNKKLKRIAKRRRSETLFLFKALPKLADVTADEIDEARQSMRRDLERKVDRA